MVTPFIDKATTRKVCDHGVYRFECSGHTMYCRSDAKLHSACRLCLLVRKMYRMLC